MNKVDVGLWCHVPQCPKALCPPVVHCKAYEDNSGALEMAKRPKIHPRIKHLNINYHHFHEHAESGEIDFVAVAIDILTKPLVDILFLWHYNALLGW